MLDRRVLILEDDELVRREIVAEVDAEPGFVVAAAAGTVAEGRALLAGAGATLALFDLRLADGSAATLIPLAREHGVHVLVLTVADDDASVYDALAAGASGYLLKADAPGRVGASLRVLRDGGSPISPRIARRLIEDFHGRGPVKAPPAEGAVRLTSREQEVVELFSRGATYGEVAKALDITVNTVRQHVRSLYDKLHVCSKAEAVVRAMSLRA
jgi:DNA-binding NarL/FixJ family response regulator